MRKDTDDIAGIFLNNLPLLDVRAPVESERGSLPSATNVPLLDNHQRELIGTEYAKHGQDAAIELGLSQVTDEIKQHRLQGWTDFIKDNPTGYLYCFRGGLRSKTTQSWLQEAGIEYPRVVGGYKAMRSYLQQEFEKLSDAGNMLVLSAPTGSGKTTLIQKLSKSVDIEGLAKHRGSAFGSLFVDQPAQATWENEVAAHWLQVSGQSTTPVMFESESHLIGRISLPKYLQDAIRSAPVVELVTPLADRIKNISDDYIGTAMYKFQLAFDREQSLLQLESFIADNLGRIQRRLGGERYKRLLAHVPAAVDEVRDNTGDHLKHGSSMGTIVKTLLLDYYDPLYAHKMKGREGQVVYRGTEKEVTHWLQATYS